ncbi:MAG TPA: hypothetical protein VEB86_18780 [Chryseosolibacter sp.]|nr:hypothetical protein [Chryseosolibacter sp.]
MQKTKRRSRKRDEVAQVVAKITGLEPRYVNMVRNGDRENETVLTIAVEYELGKSKLIQSLQKLVPITPNPKKYAREEN